MPSYRYDQLQFSTVIPNFINNGTQSFNITCSGSVTAGNTVNFTGSVTISDFSTFNDFKITNLNTNNATYLTSANVVSNIWQYAGDETIQNSLNIIGTLATVEISVFNPDVSGSITLTNQTYTIEVIGYQLPF